MSLGVAVPLFVLALVIAGVLWGARRATVRSDSGSRVEPAPANPASPTPGDRAAVPSMPLALGGETFAYRVAGTMYRQDTLAALRAELLHAPRNKRVGGRWGAFIAELRPEPDNPHDPEAVSVDAPGYGTVGWLPRGDGARYLPLLQSVHGRGFRPQCPAEVWKGPDGTLAVRLDLAAPAAIAARLNLNLRDLSHSAPAGHVNNRHAVRASS
jgi:hypothetical protein